MALALTSARAQAECSSDGAQYSTDFSASDGMWSLNSRVAIGVGGSRMTFTEPAGGSDTSLYNNDAFTAGTICADFTLNGKSDSDAAVGIGFWGSSATNYYTFVVRPRAHTYAVERQMGTKQSVPLAWESSTAFKAGPNDTNELDVTFSGNAARLYVNNQEVTEISGFAPNDSIVGLRGDGGSTSGAVWQITNFIVRT